MIRWLIFLMLVILMSTAIMAAASAGPLEVRLVNKMVSDYPDEEDLSTPESAYCVLNRIIATGEDGAWQRVSVPELRHDLPAANAPRRQISPEKAARYTEAKILEVRTYRGEHTGVIAELHGETPSYDLRILQLMEGKWLNMGETILPKIEAARENFGRGCGDFAPSPVLPKVADQEGYLRPYVDYLRKYGRDPHALVMEALAQYPLTIMGEVHHRPLYWAFNKALAEDPAFARHVSAIYLELPYNDQGLVDQFLASPTLNPSPVVDTLRDILELGWPDQAMLEFFEAVWRTNQGLPPDQRVRVVLTDMARPWKEIHTSRDWDKYDVDRDKLMADSVLRDIRDNGQDPRHGLFIVGVAHTVCNMHFMDEETPLRTAGWYLYKELGPDKLFTVCQHQPVETNGGEIGGRIALGLFDSAFAALDYKPVSFLLKSSPFGAVPYDAEMDVRVDGTYGDGFAAFLFLGRLEEEMTSPLIASFYDETFTKECDRRMRIMNGQGLVESGMMKRLDAAELTRSRSFWGKPRENWLKGLGPINLWRYGSGWEADIKAEKAAEALAQPDIIKTAGKRLFDAIRGADYTTKNFSGNNDQFITVPFAVSAGYDQWIAWVCTNFKHNPITSVEFGEVKPFSESPRDTLAMPYTAPRQDGSILKGTVTFTYLPLEQDWCGRGLDWHLKMPK